MIELYLAVLLFGVGTYFGRNTKAPVMKNMGVIKDANLSQNNNGKKSKNLVVYSKTNEKDVK